MAYAPKVNRIFSWAMVSRSNSSYEEMRRIEDGWGYGEDGNSLHCIEQKCVASEAIRAGMNHV